MAAKQEGSGQISPRNLNTSKLNETLDVDPFLREIAFNDDLKILMHIIPFLVPVLFSFIIIIGFLGNILVVFVVLMNKKMRNTTNLLILNMAVSYLFSLFFVESSKIILRCLLSMKVNFFADQP